jgi:hypothetical protein
MRLLVLKEFKAVKTFKVNCFERPKWEQPKNHLRIYNTLKYDYSGARLFFWNAIGRKSWEKHTKITKYRLKLQYLRQSYQGEAKDFSSIQLNSWLHKRIKENSNYAYLKNKVSKNLRLEKSFWRGSGNRYNILWSYISWDNIEVDLNDILIVEQDCLRNAVARKALIVENTTSFSPYCIVQSFKYPLIMERVILGRKVLPLDSTQNTKQVL